MHYFVFDGFLNFTPFFTVTSLKGRRLINNLLFFHKIDKKKPLNHQWKKCSFWI